MRITAKVRAPRAAFERDFIRKIRDPLRHVIDCTRPPSRIASGDFIVIEREPPEASYYTDVDIARLLGISLARLRNKLTAGDPLPPRIEPPGCRQRLWPRAAVHAWLARYTITATDHAPVDGTVRPTKREGSARRA
jgi:hypothetical protein